MKKSVWIINQYITTPELNGDGHRHYYIAKELEKQGHDVTLITSSYAHVPKRNNKIPLFFKVLNTDIRTLIVRGIVYKKTEGLGRIFNMLIFFLLLYFIPKKKLPKPDVIIISSISLLPILNMSSFRRRFKGCKIILEIRDVWPLSLTELGGYSPKSIFIRFLSYVEKKGYRKADHIVSLLYNVDKHIEKILGHKDFDFTWITNGYNISNEETTTIPDAVKNKIPKDKFLIGYAGSIGNANAMDYVVKAMHKYNGTDTYLCILGEGDEKKKLQEITKDNPNVIYFDRIPKSSVQSFLHEMDVLYLSYRKLPIYKLGISANKIFDYLYAAKPVLMSASVKNDPISLSGGGFTVEAENIDMICETIDILKKMSTEERNEIGQKGKEYLLHHYTYEILSKRYSELIQKL